MANHCTQKQLNKFKTHCTHYIPALHLLGLQCALVTHHQETVNTHKNRQERIVYHKERIPSRKKKEKQYERQKEMDRNKTDNKTGERIGKRSRDVYIYVLSVSAYAFPCSPWYNCHGWPGVKNQLSIYQSIYLFLSVCMDIIIVEGPIVILSLSIMLNILRYQVPSK